MTHYHYTVTVVGHYSIHGVGMGWGWGDARAGGRMHAWHRSIAVKKKQHPGRDAINAHLHGGEVATVGTEGRGMARPLAKPYKRGASVAVTRCVAASDE